MRSHTIAVIFVVVAFIAPALQAGPPHGGGHGGSAPKPPHFNPPPMPHFSPPPAAHFSQPKPAHATAGHSNAVSHGGSNAGYTSMGYYSPPRHSTTSGARSTTRLHQLANALQKAHAGKPNQAGSHPAKTRKDNTTAAEGATASVPRDQAGMGATANTANSRAQTVVADTSSLLTAGSAGSPAASAGQAAIKSTFSLSNASTASAPSANQPVIQSNLALSRSGKPGTAFRATTMGPNLPASIGTAATTASTSSTPSATSSPATNTTSPAYRMTPAYLSLMSELYGPYGLPHYSPINLGRNRYYGSRYYGSRSYGNRNNSMYFAQMRRLSRLANDLNLLSKRAGAGAGSGAGVGAGIATNMTSRIRGDLLGVVFNNGTPPYQMVHQLASDLVTHLPDRTTPMINAGQLARDLMVVMNGSGQNMGQIQSAMSSAHSLLNMSGVNGPGIQTIVNDMGLVATWGNGLMR